MINNSMTLFLSMQPYLELLAFPFINWMSHFKLASLVVCFHVMLPWPPACYMNRTLLSVSSLRYAGRIHLPVEKEYIPRCCLPRE